MTQKNSAEKYTLVVHKTDGTEHRASFRTYKDAKAALFSVSGKYAAIKENGATKNAYVETKAWSPITKDRYTQIEKRSEKT